MPMNKDVLTTSRIPLERGRDIAAQYGVSALLAPLFDFVPNSTGSMSSLPPGLTGGKSRSLFRR